MITNGYLLSSEIFEMLSSKLLVKNFQITIDGPREVHDVRRPLKNGKGSFSKILSNLRNIAHSLPADVEMLIRVNLDKTNVLTSMELIDILFEEGLSSKISLMPARVDAATPICRDVSESCISSSTFYKDYQLKFINKSINKGFRFKIYPRLVGSSCMADRINAYVIAPDGYLYKCWNEVGIETESIGFIDDRGKIKHNNKMVKWLADDPFEIIKCIRCKIFPLCGGGCPYKRKHRIAEICVSWKYNLKEMLNLYYRCQQKGGDKNEVPK